MKVLCGIEMATLNNGTMMNRTNLKHVNRVLSTVPRKNANATHFIACYRTVEYPFQNVEMFESGLREIMSDTSVHDKIVSISSSVSYLVRTNAAERVPN